MLLACPPWHPDHAGPRHASQLVSAPTKANYGTETIVWRFPTGGTYIATECIYETDPGLSAS